MLAFAMLGAGDERSTTIRFGFFELDPRSGELRKRGLKLRLPDQPFRILRALLQQPGQVVTREELKQAVWPDRKFVDSDSGINKSVSRIRALLGDSGPSPRFIETIPRRGYRFIAPVAREPGTAVEASISIAVLPFENLIADSGQAYLADGLTEELTTGLGRFDRVRVISRTSAKCCAAAAKSLAMIGRDLRVNAVIEGSVMRVGKSLRVNARLVDIQSERIVWQGKYDSEVEDLLALCERLTNTVAAEIKISLRHCGPSSRRSASVAPEAHLAYLKGRYFWSRRTDQDLYRSIDEFQRALAIDPGYAPAHTGLADAYILVGIWGLEPSHSAFCMARSSAEHALELDDNLAEAHTSLAEVLKDYDWDWTGAESAYRRAIALNPNYSTAHHFYAQLLVSLGRYAEAVEQMELARRVDPLSPAINGYIPHIYLAARDYARAVDEGRRAVELEPRSPVAHWQFGRACLFSGELGQAVAELETASHLANDRAMWQAELCFARARAGDRSGARAIVRKLATFARSNYVSPYDLALCHAGLGEADAALDHLEHAYRERVMRIISIGDPEFDSLRVEPRFASLVERLRLPRVFG